MIPAFADYRSKNFSQQARLVLRLLLHGLSNKEIGTYLKLRPSAVKNTIKRMVWQVQIPPDRPQIGLVLMFRDQIDRVDDELGKMRWQRLPARTKEAGMSALENLSCKEIASRTDKNQSGGPVFGRRSQSDWSLDQSRNGRLVSPTFSCPNG